MALDPPIQALVAGLAAAAAAEREAADLNERRRMSAATMVLASTGRGPDVVAADHLIPVDGAEIRVRVLRPAGLAAPAPALYFIHGGGWTLGDLDTAEVECGPMAAMVPCVVVSVEYRLAPEHPFPVPLEDCAAGYRWLHDNARELGIDPARVAVGGVSAGGNLTAALCLLIRDGGMPRPVLQLLDAPGLDLRPLPIPENEALGGLTATAINEYAGNYVGEDGDPQNPLISPLLADDLSDLPPAFITVAELDPLCGQGEEYLERLHAAGGAGVAFRVLAHSHGTWLIPITATFTLVREVRAAALRHAFASTLVL
ncbi:alpha/beta hydrolase [Nocardia tengchongensis]|uniref:alpha/beta hydrolase n=1 Tax=Nocardia tengchongensis TaxID=2055889 RepID=UPI00367503F4